MSARRNLALWLVVMAASSSLGCSSTSTCSRDEDQIDVGGWVNEDGTQFSSLDPAVLATLKDGKLPNGDPGPSFTYFPPNRRITFHVGLASYPTGITPTLSFSPEGDSTVAPCAGNQCLIHFRSKDEIVLHNDTCSDFYVWLTASASATPFHPVSDGGTDDTSDAEATGAAGASGS